MATLAGIYPFSFLLFVAVVGKYQPNWDSLDGRTLPEWYDEAKFGIFMHWGLYSVPAHISEWFWWDWQGTKEADAVQFMKKNYKPDFTYADFGPQFSADLFGAERFAAVVNESGAKYYVLTSKHHEGYTMWPSKFSWNWNSMDVGPKMDLVGALADAFRKNAPDVRVGLYYSLFEWFNPLYLQDKAANFSSDEYVEMVSIPQLMEIVNKYKPEVIWSDGDWEAPDKYWNSTGFLAWLYNHSPVKDTVVVNDRWGKGCMCHHGGYYTCHDKYNPGKLQKHKWENAMTVDRSSWGYRRTAQVKDILSIKELIQTLAETISCGGNLLMNVGPTADGRIIPIFEERLLQMGEWLKVNGEAVYGSKPWIYQNDTHDGKVWYTSKLSHSAIQTGNYPTDRIYNPQSSDTTTVYAFFFTWPDDGKLVLGSPTKTAKTKVTLLGYEGKFKTKPFAEDGTQGMTIDLSRVQWTRLPNTWAWVLKFENLGSDNHDPFA